jgi:platelet-activating factor acetylhydrolase
VLSLIRAPESQQKRSGVKATRHVVPYSQIPHDQTHEVWEARNKQLRIRLWELGLIFEALMAIDRGDEAIIKSNLNKSTLEAALSQFSGKLDVLDPGKVIFAGHSFGAATVVQLVKSTYYRNHPSVSSMAAPLFTPTENGAITRQITPHTPTILLDMWCFPLLSASTSALYNLPLPCYSRSAQPAMSSPPPGGNAVLAIESAHFFSWTEHLHAKARILSADPSSTSSTPDEPAKRGPIPQQPHFFYVEHSAHLSQSDFGVLFPWLTGKLCGSTQPERVLRLNVRAQLQFLRENGVVVAGTARGDLVDGLGITGGDERNGEEVKGEGNDKWVDRDEGILRREGGVDAWKWIDICGLLGDGEYPSEGDMSRETEGGESAEAVRAEEGEKEMQAEIEPSLETAVEGKLAEAGRDVLGA